MIIKPAMKLDILVKTGYVVALSEGIYRLSPKGIYGLASTFFHYLVLSKLNVGMPPIPLSDAVSQSITFAVINELGMQQQVSESIALQVKNEVDALVQAMPNLQSLYERVADEISPAVDAMIKEIASWGEQLEGAN